MRGCTRMCTNSMPAVGLSVGRASASKIDTIAANFGQAGGQDAQLKLNLGRCSFRSQRIAASRWRRRHLLKRSPCSLCVKCESSDNIGRKGSQPSEFGQEGGGLPQLRDCGGQVQLPASAWNPIAWLVDYADRHRNENILSRRAYFYPDDWANHRSAARHWRHLTTIKSSRVIRSLAPPVTTFGVIASVVAIYNYSVTDGLLPPYFILFHAPSLPYELIAPALALLLVFRTEASYSRYDEARKTWTKVISSTKDLARQSQAWIRDPKLKAALMRHTLAFPVALRCHLLYSTGVKIEDELKDIVNADELEVILSSNHRPNCILQFMTQLLMRVDLTGSEIGHLQSHLEKYNESISVCERIMRTPIPLSYTRLTSRFLVLWHLALPMILWDQCQWIVVPATIFSAATLFCIEEVGVVIEEPFPLLGLERIVAAAHIHIGELVELQVIVDNHLKKQYAQPLSSPSNGSAKRPPATDAI